jgi:RNA polymerase sigma-70 factor (ECF subfamily)
MNITCERGPYQSQGDTDTDLVRAFTEVRGPLFRKLSALLGNPTDAYDAMQTAFLNCWRARDNLPGVRNVRGWVWRVSVNAGRDLRKYLRRRRTRSLHLVADRAVCRRASPADSLVRREQEERLQAALGDLRPAEREVFQLRQDSGLTFEEIARRRGCPVGTAKPLMHTALRKLRRVLNDETN